MTAYVVAIWVLYEGKRVVSDLIDELDTLMIRRMVDAALQNTASVSVSRDLHAVNGHSIVNKLRMGGTLATIIEWGNERWSDLIIFRSKLVEAFLNHMVAVQVFDKHYNMKAECDNNGMDLSIVSKISLNPPLHKCGR
jgi:hypothetical protein